MIEVLEYKVTGEKYPDTFGYMSLGTMTLNKSKTYYFSFIRMKCLYLKKEFELILLNSFFTGEILVLGNLDNLPGDFIADREEFMRELKSIIEDEKSQIFYNSWLANNSFYEYYQYDQDTEFTVDNYGKNTSMTCWI